MNQFVHLHTHTEYSLLDSTCRINSLVSRAERLGMKALAITDTMSSFGIVEFYTACIEAGLHPVLGNEVRYLDTDGGTYNLTLLAENQRGYENILKLITNGHLDGPPEQPATSLDYITENSEGIICLTGGRSGPLDQYLLLGDRGEARKHLEKLYDIFGPNSLSLELTDHKVPGSVLLINSLLNLAGDMNIPVTAANDVHYLTGEDYEAYRVLRAIKHTTHLDDPNIGNRSGREAGMKSGGEMAELFRDIPEAIESTARLAERCQAKPDLDNFHLPLVPGIPREAQDTRLRELCQEGLRRKYGSRPRPQVLDRLFYELEVIFSKGLSGYFLVVADLVAWSRREGIPIGPGRGSSGGSIVTYLTDISEVDPLKFNLYFERFLNPERRELPDIDMDFCHKRRDEVFAYLVRRYGRESVAHCAILDLFWAHSSIRDTGRALGFDNETVSAVAELMPRSFKDHSLDYAFSNSPRLKELYDRKEPVRRLIDTARQIEGLPRHASIHASGVVVADGPLTAYGALQRAPKGEIIIQQTKDPVEALGLLKIDMLGLRFLTVVHESLELLRKTRGINLKIDDIPLDDKPTYEMLAEGDALGVFQLESTGMRNMLRKLRPLDFDDVIAVLSLYRPGPIGGGLVPDYIDRRHGRKQIGYPHPSLEPVLRETYGIVLFQEQVMRVAQVIAGFSPGKGELLRKAMTKRRPEIMDELREAFLEGAAGNGIDRDKAEKIYDLLFHFGLYGFNKAHSVAYAYTSYRLAYLKRHYPLEHLISLLNNNLGMAERIRQYISSARRNGIRIYPCDINYSWIDFSPRDSGIQIGFFEVANVGPQIMTGIIAERKRNGKFKSLPDFIRRCRSGPLTLRSLESLIKAGAFDYTRRSRRELLALSHQVWGNGSRAGQPEFPGLSEGTAADKQDSSFWEKKSSQDLERETYDYAVTGHPLDGVRDMLAAEGLLTVSQAKKQRAGNSIRTAGYIGKIHMITTKNNRKMAFLELEDKEDVIEVILFPDLCDELRNSGAGKGLLKSVVIISGSIEFEEKQPKLNAENVQSLDNFRMKIGAGIEVALEFSDDFSAWFRLKNLCLGYKGPSRLKFAGITVPDEHKRIAGYKVTPDEVFRKKLLGLKGIKRVCFKRGPERDV